MQQELTGLHVWKGHVNSSTFIFASHQCAPCIHTPWWVFETQAPCKQSGETSPVKSRPISRIGGLCEPNSVAGGNAPSAAEWGTKTEKCNLSFPVSLSLPGGKISRRPRVERGHQGKMDYKLEVLQAVRQSKLSRFPSCLQRKRSAKWHAWTLWSGARV